MMVFLKKLHKWLGLLIGLQVLLWVLSGLAISLLDPAKVSGRYWSAPAEHEQKTLRQDILLEPSELAPEHVNDARSIKLTHNRGLPVYRVQRGSGEILLNAMDGSLLIIDQAGAEAIARQDYRGNGDIITIAAGMAPDMETRRRAGKYWRVEFSDRVSTSIYISAASGEILERRNSYWRVRDFAWMLHIMDYSGRENFNNSLVIIVALISAWLGISGFILLFNSFNRHDFNFLKRLSKNNLATVSISDPASGYSGQLKLRKGSNLFLALATHGIELPSICGGGGECGKCRVKIEPGSLRAATSIETGLIPRGLREQGFRLACQMEVTDNMQLQLSKGSRINPRNTLNKTT